MALLPLNAKRGFGLRSKRATRLTLLTVLLVAGGICIAQPPTQALRYPLPGTSAPPPAPSTQLAQAPAAPQPANPEAVLFQPGQIVARVGDKTILYGDVEPTVNLILTLTKNENERKALEAQREAVVRSLVMQAVQTKMLLMEFERGMPSELRSDAKKRAEAETKLRKSVRDAFDRSLQMARDKVEKASEEELEQLMAQDPSIMRLAVLMKQRGLVSPGELDIALRGLGTTLQQQAKDYGEHMMGMEAVQSKLGLRHKDKNRKEVTHQEMLDYYQAHQADFQVPAKADFEILTARFSRFDGDRQLTHAHAAMMGNEVFLGGVPFAAVARKHSQEPLAESGGQYEGINPGSLASKTIEQAVFSLEIGKLSQILEDEQGFHILRVKQRTPAGVVSFEDAQPEIRPKIEEQKKNVERQKYLTELRARTKIWTIYDPPTEGSQAPGSLQR